MQKCFALRCVNITEGLNSVTTRVQCLKVVYLPLGLPPTLRKQCGAITHRCGKKISLPLLLKKAQIVISVLGGYIVKMVGIKILEGVVLFSEQYGLTVESLSTRHKEWQYLFISNANMADHMVNNCQTGCAKARHAKPCFFCFQKIFSKSVSHFPFHIIDRVPVSHQIRRKSFMGGKWFASQPSPLKRVRRGSVE